MKLLTFMKENRLVLGIKTDKGIVSVGDALKKTASKSGEVVPSSIMEVIERGEEGVTVLGNYLEQLSLEGHEEYLVEEDSLVLGPCVPGPDKIICVGLNYKKHADETNAPYPVVPIL